MSRRDWLISLAANLVTAVVSAGVVLLFDAPFWAAVMTFVITWLIMLDVSLHHR